MESNSRTRTCLISRVLNVLIFDQMIQSGWFEYKLWLLISVVWFEFRLLGIACHLHSTEECNQIILLDTAKLLKHSASYEWQGPNMDACVDRLLVFRTTTISQMFLSPVQTSTTYFYILMKTDQYAAKLVVGNSF